MLRAVFKAAALANPREVVGLDDPSIAREYELLAGAEKYIKAVKEEVLRRLVAGQMRDNGVVKLVNKKANRVWKADALAMMSSRFGDDAMTKPELKSPAQIEALGEVAKKLVHEYAYTPQSGYTVAPITDKRPGVEVQTITEAFKAAIDTEVV